MYERIEITTFSGDLRKETFFFIQSGFTLLLDDYYSCVRLSKRHGWKIDKKYSRIFGRDSTIKEQDVPLSQAIRDQAKKEFISKIQVLTKSEYKK